MSFTNPYNVDRSSVSDIMSSFEQRRKQLQARYDADLNALNTCEAQEVKLYHEMMEMCGLPPVQ